MTAVRNIHSFRFAIVVAIICVVRDVRAQQALEAPVQLDDVRGIAKQLEDWLQSRRVIFREFSFFHEGDNAPPDDASSFLWEEEVTAIFSGGRYRIDSRRVHTAFQFESTLSKTQSKAFDGIEARMFTRASDREGSYVGGAIYSQPPFNHGLAHHLTWLGTWVFQAETPMSLRELVHTEPAHSSLRDAGVRVWEFVHPSHNSIVEVHCALQSEVPRIVLLRERIYRNGPQGKELAGTCQMTFDGFLDETPLPQRAVMEVRHYDSEGKTLRVGLSKIELLRFEERHAESDSFSLAFPAGAAIVDERYKLGFAIGDTVLNANGTIIEVTEPLHAGSGHDLDMLLATGRIIPQGLDVAKPTVIGRLWPFAAGLFLVLVIWKPRIFLSLARWPMRRFGVLFVVLTFCACEEQSHGRLHDFGTVDVSHGTRELLHTFTVANRSSADVHVIQMSSSCGCTTAKLSATRIPRGRSVDIEIGLHIDGAGPREETVTVHLSDGRSIPFSLRAAGVRDAEIKAFPVGWLPGNRQLRIQIVYSSLEDDPIDTAPTIVVPKGIEVTIEKWSAPEGGEAGFWQLGRVLVDTTSYSGPFPFEISVTAANGLHCSTTVTEPLVRTRDG